MEREVNRGRMHPSEFHKRRADMMESLAIGIDDGKTKTSGECENIKIMVLLFHTSLK